jgi:hypothetical protein
MHRPQHNLGAILARRRTEMPCFQALNGFVFAEIAKLTALPPATGKALEMARPVGGSRRVTRIA